MAEREKDGGEERPKPPEPRNGEDLADFWREVEKEQPSKGAKSLTGDTPMVVAGGT